MTCKDCIHYDMCERLPFTEDKGEECDYFKWERRFVELPCKVGDEVYIVMPELYGNQIIKAGITQIIISHSPELEIHTFFDIHQNGRSHTIYNSYFGKTVFFTREEAEKALKEREKNA